MICSSVPNLFTVREQGNHIESVFMNNRYIGCIYRYDDPKLTDTFESYDVPWGMSAFELECLARIVEYGNECQ